MSKKKIGFDIHGVIDQKPELFSSIIKEFKELDYEIYVLTGSLIDKDLLDELKLYDIKYDKIFSILGHHREIGTEMWADKSGYYWIDEDVWNQTKAKFCNENNFEFDLDDSKNYGRHFKIPFGHITPTDENPRIIEIQGDPSDEVLSVLKKNEGYYKLKFI